MPVTPATEQFFVLTALGPDRPGLVAEVTKFLDAHGVNVEDSRMAVLGAEFAIMMLISGSEESVAKVAREAGDLEKLTGLTVSTKPTRSPEEHRKATVLPCLVTAEAIDREGIVKAVSAALHGLGINVVSLQSTAFNAPVTGTPLFRLEARVDVPQGVTVTRLRQALEAVALAENIDLDVRSLV
ncbi:MAG: ACT domain-containing protein [Polyangiaceae bacterium]